MDIVKLAGIALLLLGALALFAMNKLAARGAEKRLQEGDLEGAYDVYRSLFANCIDAKFNAKGEGHVPSALTALQSQGKTYLEKLNHILELSGRPLLDIQEFDAVITDLAQFSQRKDVMNYKKLTVKEGKPQFAEFYHRLTAFTQRIPEQLNEPQTA